MKTRDGDVNGEKNMDFNYMYVQFKNGDGMRDILITYLFDCNIEMRDY